MRQQDLQERIKTYFVEQGAIYYSDTGMLELKNCRPVSIAILAVIINELYEGDN